MTRHRRSLMDAFPRLILASLAVSAVAALGWLGSAVNGQVKIQVQAQPPQPVQPQQVQPPAAAQPPMVIGGRVMKTPAMQKDGGSTTHHSAIKLTEKSEYRQFINVA